MEHHRFVQEIVTAIFLVSSAEALRAETVSAPTQAAGLLQICATDPAADPVKNQLYDLVCMVYLHGWLDASRLFTTFPEAGRTFCFPTEGTEPELVKAVVVKWLLKNRAGLAQKDMSARVAVLKAFIEEYPCAGSRK